MEDSRGDDVVVLLICFWRGPGNFPPSPLSGTREPQTPPLFLSHLPPDKAKGRCRLTRLAAVDQSKALQCTVARRAFFFAIAEVFARDCRLLLFFFST